ncbi:MAG: hypothetical protein FJX55_02130 [Alphaproteobacteria bacterium]|nr:hypothetical protein [Alphaproteobacteria bacterium]
MTKKLLDQYEAACLVGMSPTLLTWFVSYAPKAGDPRKLKLAKKEGDLLYFEQAELLSFDHWLQQPWPHPPGQRPNLPIGIKDEVTVEANGELHRPSTTKRRPS